MSVPTIHCGNSVRAWSAGRPYFWQIPKTLRSLLAVQLESYIFSSFAIENRTHCWFCWYPKPSDTIFRSSKLSHLGNEAQLIGLVHLRKTGLAGISLDVSSKRKMWKKNRLTPIPNGSYCESPLEIVVVLEHCMRRFLRLFPLILRIKFADVQTICSVAWVLNDQQSDS